MEYSYANVMKELASMKYQKATHQIMLRMYDAVIDKNEIIRIMM